MKFDLNKPLSRLQGILVSVLACVLAFLIALITVSSRKVALADALRLSATNISDVQVDGEYIYYLEAGSLHCVTVDGRFKWNTGVDRSSRFRVSSSGIAVWRSSRVQILDKSNGVVVGNISASGDILSAVVGDVYTAAIVGPEHNSTVILTDKYGNTVDTVTGFDGVTVLDCGFFQGRELFWIMSLNSSGSTPSCKISIYKPGKREMGSIMDMNQVIYNVVFRASNICAVGTQSLDFYNYYGKKNDESIQVYGWHLEAVDKTSDDPLMLFVPDDQLGEEMTIKDVRCVKGEDISYLHFPVPCTQLMALENTVYGFAGNYLGVGSFGSSVTNIYNLPVNVTSVLGITSKRYAVVTGGSSIYVIKLPKE